MKSPTYQELRTIAARKNYRWFTKPFDLNVWGIRNPASTNLYDDTLAVAYKDQSGNERVFLCPITTDPGRYYLQNPINTKGCAILAAGQYLGSHRIGRHQGKYKALVQVKPVTVLRDYNRDKVLDFNYVREDTGLFGINIHRASETNITPVVDKWSAGCQVVQNPVDFLYLLSLVDQQHKYIGSDVVSYTLILESDLS